MELVKSLPAQLPKLRFLDQFMANHPGYIAGGCFKNLFLGDKIKDVDIFFEDISAFQAAEKVFESNEMFSLAYKNDRVIAFRQSSTGIIVELIGAFFNKPSLMIGDFDFTITKAFYGKNEQGEYEFWHHERFFEHLMNKKLVLDDKMLFPLSTFNRSFRYTRYGFGLCGESKVNLIQALQGFNGVNQGDFYFGID